MSLRFALLRILPATAVRRYVLDRLATSTAAAFGVAAPEWNGLPFPDRLAAYAEFTAAQATRLGAGHSGSAASSGGAQAPAEKKVGDRLYRNAAELGAEFRRRFGISEPREAFAALQFLYRQIGIEITGGAAPAVEVTRCFFSCFYTPDTCRLMSAFDAGVVAGLFGGASLEFSERITEGAGCCRALLRASEGRA